MMLIFIRKKSCCLKFFFYRLREVKRYDGYAHEHNINHSQAKWIDVSYIHIHRLNSFDNNERVQLNSEHKLEGDDDYYVDYVTLFIFIVIMIKMI